MDRKINIIQLTSLRMILSKINRDLVNNNYHQKDLSVITYLRRYVRIKSHCILHFTINHDDGKGTVTSVTDYVSGFGINVNLPSLYSD